MKQIFILSIVLILAVSCSKELQEAYLLEKPELYLPPYGDYFVFEPSTQVCFGWKAVEGADKYYLEVSECNDFEIFMFQETIISGTRFCININELSCKENVNWRVQALGENGKKSEFSYGNYRYVVQRPSIGFFCCLPEFFNIVVNGNIQISSENTDSVFLNITEEIEIFNCGDSNPNTMKFIGQESIFQNISIDFNPSDGLIAPRYYQINETDSVFISGNVFYNDYHFDSIHLTFGNNATGEIIGVRQ